MDSKILLDSADPFRIVATTSPKENENASCNVAFAVQLKHHSVKKMRRKSPYFFGHQLQKVKRFLTFRRKDKLPQCVRFVANRLPHNPHHGLAPGEEFATGQD
jgi:hypothetical protein